MEFLRTLILTLSLLSSLFLSTQGVDKYTDENRPYEFGFNIEGEQHRHEKKDEKGLIMGEFGFITADGVYHVTVYATDEEGRFKILSMKNIRVKPYPTSKQTSGSGRQGHSLETAPQPQQTPTSKSEEPLKKITIEKPARSCSSCSLPTTTTIAPPVVQSNNQNAANSGQSFIPSNQYPDSKSNSSPNQQNFPANQNSNNNPGINNNFQSPVTSLNTVRNPQALPDQDLVAPKEDLPLYPPLDTPLQNNPTQPHYSQNKNPQQQSNFGTSRPSNQIDNAPARTPKRLDSPQQGLNSVGTQPNNNQDIPQKPTLISARMQIVDKNTDVYRRGPGENEGLPKGLTKNDMSQLLYTFNYTVGFHGHFEEGYRNGAKQGYYFVTGRNGVRTRVDYVADEKGFRPKITQEVLDLLSEDVPKEETEKDEKYGLKGYEFKWLYFPTESNGR